MLFASSMPDKFTMFPYDCIIANFAIGFSSISRIGTEPILNFATIYFETFEIVGLVYQGFLPDITTCWRNWTTWKYRMCRGIKKRFRQCISVRFRQIILITVLMIIAKGYLIDRIFPGYITKTRLRTTVSRSYLLLWRNYLLGATSLRHNNKSKWLRQIVPGLDFAQF